MTELRFRATSEASVVGFFSFIFISWRLITLQYCCGFCHTNDGLLK